MKTHCINFGNKLNYLKVIKLVFKKKCFLSIGLPSPRFFLSFKHSLYDHVEELMNL